MNDLLPADVINENTALLTTIALLYVAISMQELRVGQRTAVIYAYCMLMSYLGVVDYLWAAVGSFVALFLMLEVFSTDRDLVSLYSIGYKITDYAYRLLFELYGVPFYLLLCLHYVLRSLLGSTFMVSGFVLSSIVILSAMASRHRFSTKTVTYMLAQLVDCAGDPAFCTFDENDRKKLDILVFMEDGNFYERREKEHRLTLAFVFSKVRRQLKDLVFGRRVRNKSLRRFVRGYGSIEMQILRNIGLSFGSFQLTIRRKAFEIVFSQTLYNSFILQFDPKSDARRNIKDWILKCYLNIVPVKVKKVVTRPMEEKSTFSQLFGKEFSDLSLEEFFVWCLGLPHYEQGVGFRAVDIHEEVVLRFDLSKEKICTVLRSLL